MEKMTRKNIKRTLEIDEIIKLYLEGTSTTEIKSFYKRLF
jgi:hypothetical protein